MEVHILGLPIHIQPLKPYNDLDGVYVHDKLLLRYIIFIVKNLKQILI